MMILFYYAKITNTRTYMNIDRITVSEYWFTKDKYCSVSNQYKIIVRKDLGDIGSLIYVQVPAGLIR